MQRIRQYLGDSLFARVPKALEATFAQDRALRNSFRFMLLPYFNIFTQLSCYIIYLYIYPAVYPQRPRLDVPLFTALSAVYIVANLSFIILFTKLRQNRSDPKFTDRANGLTSLFLIFYVLFEGIETCLEVEISGNIYRFLATFFMVAFLPILPRLQKSLYLVGYTVVVQIGFAVLIGRGYIDVNRYREIVVVFLIACLILSNITSTSTLKSFLLRQELLEANRRLQELSVTDPLTGIANRRAFDEYLRKVWNDCRRNGGELFAIMIDIDWFKLYNDQYGHPKGDECLQRVATCLQRNFKRSSDMVARYGGEEFVVLLPYSKREGVLQLAEQVRAEIEALDLTPPHPPSYGHVTICLGVAGMRPMEDKEGCEALIKNADDALYDAKHNGRNCVQVAGEAAKTA